MTTAINIVTVRSLIRLASGSSVDAMEAAKQLASSRDPTLADLLLEIALDRTARRWSRIAAVYTLGFLGHRKPVVTLARLLADLSEPSVLRSHAAEALGNLGDPRIVGILRDRLEDRDEAMIVRGSAAYALSQIRGRAAESALREFRSTKPRGRVFRELFASIDSR